MSCSASIIDDPFGDMTEYVPFLKECARGKRVLEIGVRGGVSTKALLSGVMSAGGHVWSVDRKAECGSLFRYNPFWTFVHADSTVDVKRVIQAVGEAVDVLMIDGSHRYENVCADLKNYVPMVRVGGLILMHDVNLSDAALEKIAAVGEDWAGEPRRAMDEFVAAHPKWKWWIIPGGWGLGVIERGDGE